MMILGITGSIGMGKSTLATMLQKQGVHIHDSDHAVHEALKIGGQCYDQVIKAFGQLEEATNLIDKDTSELNRAVLGQIIFADPHKRDLLEKILHPVVRHSQDQFIRGMRLRGQNIIGLDIPLLFETGAEARVDKVIVASAPYAIQRQRVLARPGMNEQKFHAILERQMPDGEKCARADYIVHTGLGLAHAMKELKKILHDLRDEHRGAKKGSHINQKLETHLVEL